MGEVTIKLNGIERRVPEGITILEAARLFQVEIPTLCYLKDINEIGACRMCVVEVKGAWWLPVFTRSMTAWRYGPIPLP